MNLEPETRRGYYISAEMKKVWAVEMELLNKLLEVCKKHNLRIWAEGGTLLGAVREHGYIPWDDDIDMAMPREDYDKLQIIAKDEFTDPYFFQSGYTDKFPSGMSKLRMNGTSAIEKNRLFRNCHHGIFVDIFPLDVMPDNDLEMKAFVNKSRKLHRDLILYFDYSYSRSFYHVKSDLYALFNRIKIDFISFRTTFKKYDLYVKQYCCCNYKNISLISWLYNDRYLRSREWYKETLQAVYEDIEIPIPCGYQKILSKQFGDNYMIPIHSPSMHAGFDFLSAEISYEIMLPIIRKRKATLISKL